MRPQLKSGALTALALHLGAAYFGQINTPLPARPVRIDPEPIPVPLPSFPNDSPETKPEAVESRTEPVDLPPIIPDRPQLLRDEALVIDLDPTLPLRQLSVNPLYVIPRQLVETGNRVFSMPEVDQVPQPTFQAAPVYPAEMRRRGIPGDVVVAFVVGPDGTIRDLRVLSSSRPEFERAALEAVQRWKFRPGRRAGQPVSVRMELPLYFRIE